MIPPYSVATMDAERQSQDGEPTGARDGVLAARDRELVPPRSSIDHSHTGSFRGRPTLLGIPSIPPAKICDENPLAGLDLR